MNTMQNLSRVLRGLAIAGLCAAGLAVAAPAQTQTLTLTDTGPSSLPPKGAIPSFIAPPPLLVAPGCPGCWIRRGLIAPDAVTAPSAPLLVAPRGCGGGSCSTLMPDLMAPSAPLLVAPGGCGSNCTSPSDVEYAWKYRTPLRLASGPAASVVDACHARQCAG